MFGITSWKTTAAGVLPILGAVYDLGNMFVGNGAPDGNKLLFDLGLLSAGIMGFVAKDHNVSNAPSPLVTPKPVP